MPLLEVCAIQPVWHYHLLTMQLVLVLIAVFPLATSLLLLVFDCFRVVLFKECIVHQRPERHSGCRECASSSTVIKKVQETGCSLQNHAVLPQQLSSDTQGLIHKTELQALKGSPSERSQSVLEVSYPGSQREKDTFAILGVSARAL